MIIDLIIILSLTVYLAFVSRWHGGGFFKAPKIVKTLIWALPFVSRWHGGGFFKAPKIVKTLIWALPFGVSSFIISLGLGLKLAAVLGVSSFILCALGKATSHGGFMDLGTWDKPRENERLELLIKPLKGKIPEYCYDALGLAVVGLASVSGGIIPLAIQNPFAGPILAIGGVSKALAYMIGWQFLPTQGENMPVDMDEHTEIGEILTGAFAGFTLGLALALI